MHVLYVLQVLARQCERDVEYLLEWTDGRPEHETNTRHSRSCDECDREPECDTWDLLILNDSGDTVKTAVAALGLNRVAAASPTETHHR